MLMGGTITPSPTVNRLNHLLGELSALTISHNKLTHDLNRSANKLNGLTNRQSSLTFKQNGR